MFSFTGTAVSWIGVKCNVCGIAAVSIDGGVPITVNTAGPKRAGRPRLRIGVLRRRSCGIESHDLDRRDGHEQLRRCLRRGGRVRCDCGQCGFSAPAARGAAAASGGRAAAAPDPGVVTGGGSIIVVIGDATSRVRGQNFPALRIACARHRGIKLRKEMNQRPRAFPG